MNSNSEISIKLINKKASSTQFALSLILSLICSFGLVFYLQSLKYSPVSISVPLSSINIFGILTAILVLKEQFQTVYYFSFGIGILGVLLTQSYNIWGEKFSWNIGGTYSILAACFWGFSYTLFKYSSQWIGAIPLAFLLESSVVATALIWVFLSEPDFFKNKLIYSRSNIKHYLILASFLLCGTVFFNLSVQKIPILVINVFGFFTLFVSILVGIIFHKEKLSINQFIGVCCLLFSILLVQIFGH